ncbi:hypothetical protein QR680_013797 [Steinernema hermaphroditum]|uniref:Secreted protein n=1 Tax=Steinernema hermaphroditum TaxID=289476 RepID=A0AA39M341_9BILA|nr:hypothetical protein QR680_013797 [Steinernema hermaphroditum]
MWKVLVLSSLLLVHLVAGWNADRLGNDAANGWNGEYGVGDDRESGIGRSGSGGRRIQGQFGEDQVEQSGRLFGGNEGQQHGFGVEGPQFGGYGRRGHRHHHRNETMCLGTTASASTPSSIL